MVFRRERPFILVAVDTKLVAIDSNVVRIDIKPECHVILAGDDCIKGFGLDILIEWVLKHEFLAFARGVCPVCVGNITVQFIPASEGPFHSGEDLSVLTRLSCSHCGAKQYLSVGAALLKDPGLISFCHERGLDVTTTPVWELDFAATDRYVCINSTDPWEIALELTLDGDMLELVVDDNLTVIERNRPLQG